MSDPKLEYGAPEWQELDDCDPSHESQDEQQQHLLGDHTRTKTVVVRRSRRWLALFIALVLLLLAVLGAWAFFLSDQGLVEAAIHHVTIQHPSYILNDGWDFDAPPQRREYSWVIRDRLHNPDGVLREMILANDNFPGPLIEANVGDNIVVHVDNQAINATSIHWHGLYQNGTPHMDGTIGVTQCPIAPGGRFTYDFNVSGQHGTYWWHGHQGVQASDGLHGPLVIHSPEERELQKLRYDTDRVILLSDHYHDLSAALTFQYLMPDAENAEPVPNGALIDGQGVQDCSNFPNRKCDNTTENVAQPTFGLAKGQKHRLRLINVGAFAEFQFQVDDHELAVTEVDGTDVNPVWYHRVNINPAQRYSVIIDTNSTAADQFWLRARMIKHCFTDPPATLNADALGILHYGGVWSGEVPVTLDWDQKLDLECRDLNTSALEPVQVQAPPSADAVFYIRSNFEIGAYRLSRGYFNSSSWRPQVHSPSLFRSIGSLQSIADDAVSGETVFVNNHSFDSKTELVLQSSGIKTIDLLISNFDDGNHPLHLHGYKFFVLAQGHGAPPLTRVDAAIDMESLAPLYSSLNTTNPLRRDTASVEAFGWILIRLVADNPGVWGFHCHVSWHAEAGLLMSLATRVDDLASLQIPQAALDLCKAGNLEAGMAPPDAFYEAFAK